MSRVTLHEELKEQWGREYDVVITLYHIGLIDDDSVEYMTEYLYRYYQSRLR